MADYADRERYIPYRRSDVVEMCLREGRLPSEEAESFRELCRILQSLFHFEFHERLESLKDSYAPFNPDADTRRIREVSGAELAASQASLVRGLTEVLNAANYERVTQEDLERALAEESLFKIRLHVDFEDFEEVIFFARGRSTAKETLRRFLGLGKQELEFVNLSRVLIYVKFKKQAWFDAAGRKDLFFRPGSTIIKLFQDVPAADLEMLFPNTEVRMKPVDKLLIGVPAAIGGIAVVATKLLGTIFLVASLVAFWLGLSRQSVRIDQGALVALAIGLATLGGYVIKQISNFKARKLKFMKTLSDSLYFKNLDNNAGVLNHLFDAAEEEECKEAILGYYFLLTSERGLSEPELDDVIEDWFERKWGCRIDFEADDALHKLVRLELVSRGGEILRARPLAEAKSRLDYIWDNYFDYNREPVAPVS
ncbi:MAG: TMEM143 family protein [Planctomycetota bacterium]